MKEPSPGAQRQQFYRWEHPQLNITFQSRDEEATVLQACRVQHNVVRLGIPQAYVRCKTEKIEQNRSPGPRILARFFAPLEERTDRLVRCEKSSSLGSSVTTQ